METGRSRIISPLRHTTDTLQSCTEHSRLSIVPLIVAAGCKRLKLVGSSVYISVGHRRFLITAMHVAREFEEKPILVPRANGKLGPPRVRELVGFDHEKADVAVAELSEPLQAFETITADNISCFDLVARGMLFAAIGYPETKSKMYEGNFTADSMTFFTEEASKPEYSVTGADEHFNVVVQFGRKIIHSRSMQEGFSALPYGMSGGGLFWLPRTAKFEKRTPVLVGVLTEWDDKSKRTMTATKMLR